MDNIFEILIYLFIIISFLSSFLKKKKKAAIKQEQVQDQTPDQQPIAGELNAEQAASVQTQEEEYDILKDFEDFFKVGKTEEKPQILPHPEPIEEVKPSTKERSGVPEDSFHTKTASEHTFIDPWDVKKTEIDKRKKSLSPDVERQATAFEKYLKKPETSATRISRKIKESIMDPASLKEYVIISEIMGKPKALKR
ncbi:MAG: hypothetical protein JSW63_08730 [Ignavibacterium sp.]|nr:MAG: hypothetical protein JSW63_08730 [Ignavibacterium sp.]